MSKASTHMNHPLNVRLLACVGLTCVMIASVTSSCSGASPRSTAEVPAWALSPPEGLCGVGSAALKGPKVLARTTAVARGRAHLASQVALQVESLLSAFEAEGAEGSVTRQLSAQRVSQRLIGSKVRREQVAGRELFVLVCIGGERVTEALEREVEIREVSLTQRRALRQRSKEAFKELEAQLEAAFPEGD